MNEENTRTPRAAGSRSFKYLWLYALGIFSAAALLISISLFSHNQREQQTQIETLTEKNEELDRENRELREKLAMFEDAN